MKYFVHPSAICESTKLGDGTRISAFTHVLSGAEIGNDCCIWDYVFIENEVLVGDRVTIKCGAQILDGVEIESDVVIGPNVTFSSDPFASKKNTTTKSVRTVIRSGATIGANAIIAPGLVIGVNAVIGAGSVVTSSVPPHARVVGNPAKIVGYMRGLGSQVAVSTAQEKSEPGRHATAVQGVAIFNFRAVPDMRGSLTVGEFEKEIPFKPSRYFLVHDVPTAETRGEHAHLKCHQFLIAVKGTVHVVADDGTNREEYILDRNNIGIYLPPMIWGIQYQYTSDAVLLVFASDYYDPADYIRDYDLFLQLAKASVTTK
jgi:UDP-2-acetamido-3-amino-2,3-dideoxy-glucuronate N-acetyltransferase